MKENKPPKSKSSKNRGSLSLFLDDNVNTKVYGGVASSSSAKEVLRSSQSGGNLLTTPPMKSSHRPQSAKTYFQTSNPSPASAYTHTSGESVSSSQNLATKVVHGHLQIDGTKLKEECIKSFDDKWFCKSSERFTTHRVESVELFDVDKEFLIPMIMPRPKTAEPRSESRRESFSTQFNSNQYDVFSNKPKSIDGSHITGIGGSITSNTMQHSVLGNHSIHSSYHPGVNKEIASMAELLGDYEASVVSTPPVQYVDQKDGNGFTHSLNHGNNINPYNNSNNENYTMASQSSSQTNANATRANLPNLTAVNIGPKKRVNRPSTAPAIQLSSSSHRLQHNILQKQTMNMQRFSKARSGLDRPNNPDKLITADYVLFLECLRRDIFPYYDNQLLDGNNDQNHMDLEMAEDDIGHASFVEHHQSLHEEIAFADNSFSYDGPSTSLYNTYSHNQSQSLHHTKVMHRGPLYEYNSFLSEEKLRVKNSHILTLDLSNQGIGVEKGICLSQALVYCPLLEVCNLSNNRLNDKALHAILKTLFYEEKSMDKAYAQKFPNSALQYLNLAQNEMGKLSITLLASFLRNSIALKLKSESREDIDLTLGNALDSSMTLEGEPSILWPSESVISSNAPSSQPQYLRNSTIQYLNLNNCHLGDEYSYLIGKSIQSLGGNSTVIELHLQGNRIGAEESNHTLIWSELIASNSPLEVLNLSHNFLRKRAASLIFHSLAHNQHMVSVNVGHNQITDFDVIQSIHKIESNSSLQHLDLSYNQLTNIGCIAASYSASQWSCSHLQMLDLNGNRMGNIAFRFAMERVLHVLHGNQHLHTLVHQPMPSKTNSKPTPSTKPKSMFDDEDESDKKSTQQHVPQNEETILPCPKIYRVLHIAGNPSPHSDNGIQPTQSLNHESKLPGKKSTSTTSSKNASTSGSKKKGNDEEASVQPSSTGFEFFNPYELSGKSFILDLSNPYDYLKARLIMEAIEANPLACSFTEPPPADIDEDEKTDGAEARNKEKGPTKPISYGSTAPMMKWYNSVMKATEYVTMTRSHKTSREYFQSIYSQLVKPYQSIELDYRIAYHPQFSPLHSYHQYEYSHDPYVSSHRLIALLQQLIELSDQVEENDDVDIKHARDKLQKLLVEIGYKLGFIVSSELLSFLLERWDEWKELNDSVITSSLMEVFVSAGNHSSVINNQNAKKPNPAPPLTSGSNKSFKPPKLKKQRSVYGDLDEEVKQEKIPRNPHETALLHNPLVVLKFLLSSIFDFIQCYDHRQIITSQNENVRKDMTIHRLYAHRYLLHGIIKEQVLPERKNKTHSSNPFLHHNHDDTNKPQGRVDPIYEHLVRFISELSFEYNNTSVLNHQQREVNPISEQQTKAVAEILDQKKFTKTTPDKKNTNPQVPKYEDTENVSKFFTIDSNQFVEYVLQSIMFAQTLHYPSYSLQLSCNSATNLRTHLPSYGILTVEHLYFPAMQSHHYQSFQANNHYLFESWMRLFTYNQNSLEKDHVLFRNDGMKRSVDDILRQASNPFYNDPSALLDTILNILTYSDNILHLSCDQAEEMYKFIYSQKTYYHLYIIEKLCYQISSSVEVIKFLIRNCYLHEMVLLRKKLQHVFNIWIGQASGHYVLDLVDPLHRQTVKMLVAFHHSSLVEVKHHIQSNLPAPIATSIRPNQGKKSSQHSTFSVYGFEENDFLYFRNATYNGKHLKLTCKWLSQSLPQIGKLRFDYIDIHLLHKYGQHSLVMQHLHPTSLVNNANTLSSVSQFYTSLYGHLFMRPHLPTHPIFTYQSVTTRHSSSSSNGGGGGGSHEDVIGSIPNMPQVNMYNCIYSQMYFFARLAYQNTHPDHATATATATATSTTSPNKTTTAAATPPTKTISRSISAPVSLPANTRNTTKSLYQLINSTVSSLDAMILKKEAFGDLLIQQLFGDKTMYQKSLKLAKKLKLTPKNLLIIHSHEEVDKDGRRIAVQSYSKATLEDINTRKGNILNIMLKNYTAPTSTVVSIGKNGIRKPKRNSEDEDDDDEDDEVEEEDYDDLSQWNRDNMREKILQNLKQSKNNPRNLRLISKESFFKLQDQTNNLDTGSRAAFVLQNHTIPVPETTDPNVNPPSPSTSMHRMSGAAMVHPPPQATPVPIAKPAITDPIEKKYDNYMKLYYKDLLETSLQTYMHCYQEEMTKQTNQIFQELVKQLAQHHQYHFSSDKEAYPEELFESEAYQNLIKREMKTFLHFRVYGSHGHGNHLDHHKTIHGGKKTLKKGASSIFHRSSMSPMMTNIKHHSFNSLSQEELESRLTDCLQMDTSLLILQICLLYHVQLDTHQAQMILEAMKTNKAHPEILMHAISILLPHVVDVDHFSNIIRKVLGEQMYQECLHRFGYLHMWSPLHPEGKYDFDMMEREHRDALVILATLSLQDPTMEIIDCQYQITPMHAWEPFDLQTCAMRTMPHTNGLTTAPIRRPNPPPSAAQNKAQKNNKDVVPKSVYVNDLRTGRVQLRVKTKTIDSLLNPPTPELPEESKLQPVPTQATLTTETNVPPPSASNLPAPAPLWTSAAEIIARQQAARYVFLQYKHSLLQHYLLYPSSTSAYFSTSATMNIMFNVYPNFK